MSIEKITELASLTEELSAFIRSDLFLQENNQTISALEHSHHNLMNRRYVVSVIAAMKAGKSTTFNALLGRDLLPNENASCTTAITEVKHANEMIDRVTKVYKDGAVKLIKAEGGKTLEENFQEDVRASRRNDEVKNIEKYYVECPVRALEGSSYKELVQNFILVDTPGPNEANVGDFDVAELQRIALEQLRHSDALIILFDYQNYKSDTNANILKSIFENREDLEKDQDKIYFLVNKIDAMTSKDGTIADTLLKVKQLIREHAPIIKNPNVFAFSAKQACLARSVINQTATEEMKNEMKTAYGSKYSFQKEIDGDVYEVIPSPEKFADQLLKDSQIVQIEEKIIEKVFDRASEQMMKNGFHKAEQAILDIVNSVQAQIEISSKTDEEIYLGISESKTQILTLKDKGEKIKNLPAKHLDLLKSQVQSIITQIPDTIQKTINGILPKEDILQSEDQHFLNERIQSIQRDVANMIEISLNREVDRIQRLAFETQNKISTKLTEEFQKLSDSANEMIGKKLTITLRSYNIQEISKNQVDQKDADVREKDKITDGMETVFDPKQAAIVSATTTTLGATIGGAVGSVFPVIGTAIGAAVGGAIGGLIGYFSGGKSSKPVTHKKKFYTADISEMKKSLAKGALEIAGKAGKDLENSINQLEVEYSAFIGKQLDEFIANLNTQLDEMMAQYEANKNDLDQHMGHMNVILKEMEVFEERLKAIESKEMLFV
ncbi:dynamin family protein [Litchfieldia alkalitelluris]|uniref:dynamin family protein n=1 Tax=Litchfieldia alkalitelluris TaxID=304268 RepID=UPI0009977E7E|nr:dynamin family protein [Litchfieldia alkalitelluris]